MLTVLMLVEAYSKPTLLKKASVNTQAEYSVWIVPAGTEQDGEIDDLLARAGIRVLERVSHDAAEGCAEDICRKFEAAGVEAKKEMLCND
jgi:hypothetical protein